MQSLVACIKARFKSNVPEKDRVPFGQKVAYGLGNSVEGLAVWIPMGVLTPVFNIGLGLSPALIGVILSIWIAYDALADPIMGNISDNTRTRWGRRRPYIFTGAILTALIFPLIWWAPRTLPEHLLFWWLLIGGILLRTVFTVWAMPYYSLQLEMTADYNERTNVSAYRAFFGKIIGLIGGWVLAIASLDYFADASGEPDLVQGMRVVSIVIAILIVSVGILPAIFTQERYYEAEASQQEKQRLFKSLKKTLSTRPFLILVVMTIAQIFGMGIVGTLGFYVNAYYVCEGDVSLAAKVQGVIQTALFIPGIVLIPFCSWVASRYGKRMLLYFVTVCSILGYLTAYIFFIPGQPYWQIVPALFKGVVGVGLWMIVPSMQADIADYDELSTNARREGSFSSVFSFGTKVAWTINSTLSGIILVVTGFNVELGAEQPEHVLRAMFHLYIWIPVAFLVVALIMIKIYPLTREKMVEIREQLESRRGTIGRANSENVSS